MTLAARVLAIEFEAEGNITLLNRRLRLHR